MIRVRFYLPMLFKKKLISKRALGLTLSVILIATGLFILVQIVSPIKPQGKGAIQVLANIKSTVSLNGKVIGTTPVCKCTPADTIPSGDYTIVITPDDTSVAPYTLKATVDPGVLTA